MGSILGVLVVDLCGLMGLILRKLCSKSLGGLKNNFGDILGVILVVCFGVEVKESLGSKLRVSEVD